MSRLPEIIKASINLRVSTVTTTTMLMSAVLYTNTKEINVKDIKNKTKARQQLSII
jgi:hypothetical protein